MKHRILIVEDDQLIREAVADYLTEMGYVVVEAEDGQQGVDLFKASAFNKGLIYSKHPPLISFF